MDIILDISTVGDLHTECERMGEGETFAFPLKICHIYIMHSIKCLCFILGACVPYKDQPKEWLLDKPPFSMGMVH